MTKPVMAQIKFFLAVSALVVSPPLVIYKIAE